MNVCICLMLIRACVIYWQAKEISRVVRWCQSEEDTIVVALLEHASPIEWDNVMLYGNAYWTAPRSADRRPWSMSALRPGFFSLRMAPRSGAGPCCGKRAPGRPEIEQEKFVLIAR